MGPDINEIISGAQWLVLSRHVDDRGTLTVFDPDGLPFDMQRYFLIEAEPGSTRAGHSSTAHELIAVIRGRVTCDLDNGAVQTTVHLEAGGQGLWLRPGVWLLLHAFAPYTILGVAASQRYAEVVRWATPNAALVGVRR
jgi:hypothetical protein